MNEDFLRKWVIDNDNSRVKRGLLPAVVPFSRRTG